MAVLDSIKAIGHGIGWLIPGVQEAQALEASANAHRQQALRNKIDEYRSRELANPQPDDNEWHQRINLLNQLSQETQQMGPFDNPKKHAQRLFEEYEAMHPAAYGQPSQPPKVTSTPGPPTQGQPMGQPNVSVSQPQSQPIPSIGDLTGGVVGSGIQPLNASFAGKSPVQPSQQGGGAAQSAPAAFPQLPEPPKIAGVGDQGTGDDTQTFSITANGLNPEAPKPLMPPRPAYQLPPPSLEHNTYNELAAAMRESQQPYVQAQAAVEQTLNTLRGSTEFQMAEAPRKLEMIKQAIGPEGWDALDKLPGFKTELIGAVYGVQLPGIGQMFTPHMLTPDALGEDLMKQYPELAGKLDPKTRYELRWSPGQGYIPSPRGPQLRVGSTDTGQAGVIDVNKPGEGIKAVPGSAGRNDFDTYLQTFLTQHKLPLTPYTMRQALAEWTSAGQKPPQNMVLVPNDKDGTWTSQIVKPGVKVDPRAVTVGGLNTENVPTAAVRTQAQLSAPLSDEAERIKGEIRQMSAAIGPLMGRGYKFTVNKVGVDFPQFANLDTKLDAFSTAFMKAHGLRGKDYHDAILKQLSAAQSPDDLIARIDGMEDFLKGYMQAGNAGKPKQPEPITPVGLPNKGDTFAGSKVKSIKMVK